MLHERHGVLNHWQLDCLSNSSPTKGPLMRKTFHCDTLSCTHIWWVETQGNYILKCIAFVTASLAINTCIISTWPGDAIWRHRSGSTLGQVMAWSIAAPSHYMNQCWCIIMMTSSNGNIFRVTDHLCGEFTGHRWISRTKASDAELYVFFDLCLNKRFSK